MDISKLSRNYQEQPLKYGEQPLKEDLEELYINQQLSVESIAEYFNTSVRSLNRWLSKQNVKRPTKKVEREQKLPQEYIDKLDLSRLSRDFQKEPWKTRQEEPIYSDFYYLFITQNWTAEDIAEYIGASKGTVTRIIQVILKIRKSKELHQESREKSNMRKYGVKSTSSLEAVKEKRDNTNLERMGVKSYLCRTDDRLDDMERIYGKRHAKQIKEFVEKGKETFKRNHGGKDFTEVAKEAVLEKYGVDNILKTPEGQKLAKQGMKEKYGEEHTMHVPEIKNKVKQTNMSIYGSASPLGNADIQEQIKADLLENFGVEHISQVPGICERVIATKREKYGESLAQFGRGDVHNIENYNIEYWMENFKDSRSGRIDLHACAKYHNVQADAIRNQFKKAGITGIFKGSHTSELEVIQYVEKLGFDVIQRDKTLVGPNEIDCYIPEANLAVEFDGLMYHSQGNLAEGKFFRRVHPNYHLDKTKGCAEKGVQLLHIFENEWLVTRTRHIWKSLIKSKLGLSDRIFARNTKIAEVSELKAKQFCEENHLQGHATSSVRYGLYYNDELVALMTFSKPRFNKKADWELLRFCCKKDITVVGGASRLLKHFRKNHEGLIVSYANLRWSNGNLYEQLGFTLVDQSEPNYFYFKVTNGRVKTEDLKLLNRMQFQKHKLADKLENFDAEKTEKENMYANGYNSIYDCGNLVYLL